MREHALLKKQSTCQGAVYLVTAPVLKELKESCVAGEFECVKELLRSGS